MSRLSRLHVVQPGYDCKYAPCQHAKKGDHGIHGEEWIYVVTDGEAAVNLTIYTSRFPATVPPIPRIFRDDAHGNMAADLGLHTSYPRWDEHSPQASCRWLDGKTCYYDGSGLNAREFWRAHGNGAKAEQEEFFWLALETTFAEWTKEAGEARARQSAPTTERVK